jgi:hypothetical protein
MAADWKQFVHGEAMGWPALSDGGAERVFGLVSQLT